MYRYKEANFYKYMIKMTCMLYNTGFKINILELDIFVGCFVYVPFFVPAILEQAICLLGESTGMPPMCYAGIYNKYTCIKWMTHALNNTI